MTLRTICFLMAALLLSGCLQHTYEIGTGPPENAEIVYKHWHHHWIFGLIRPKLQQELDVARLCPDGNARIHQEQSFVNGLVDILTAFIYTPTTVTVTCGEAEGVDVEISAEEVARIVTDPHFPAIVERWAPERLVDLESRTPMTTERFAEAKAPAVSR